MTKEEADDLVNLIERAEQAAIDVEKAHAAREKALYAMHMFITVLQNRRGAPASE